MRGIFVCWEFGRIIKLNQYFFCTCAYMVYIFLCLVKERYKNKVSACFYVKNLLILKLFQKPQQNFCSGFLFLSLVDCVLCIVQCTCHRRLSEQILESQATFAATSTLTRVSGRNFRNSLLISKKHAEILFLIQFRSHQEALTRYLDLQKIFIS